MIEMCSCTPEVRVRKQPEWNLGMTLYGYGVGVTVRVHFAPCMLADEVLGAWAVKVSA